VLTRYLRRSPKFSEESGRFPQRHPRFFPRDRTNPATFGSFRLAVPEYSALNAQYRLHVNQNRPLVGQNLARGGRCGVFVARNVVSGAANATRCSRIIGADSSLFVSVGR